MNRTLKSIIIALLAVLFVVDVASAGALLSYPKFRAKTDSDAPLVGGLLYTYIPGSTTLKPSYSDYNCATANSNPIVLDSRGEATVYLSGRTKLVLKTSAGATVWTMDNVDGSQNGYVLTVDPTETDQCTSGAGNSLYDVLTALGTSKNATVALIHNGASNQTTYTCSTTFDASSYKNTTIEFQPGAVIAIGAGKTLTLSGVPIRADRHQIFSGTGSAALSGTVYPEWWGGNTSPGTTDMTDELIAAAASVSANGGTVSLGAESYKTSAAWDIPDGVSVIGSGIDKTVIDCTGDDYGIDGTEYWQMSRFSDFTITFQNNGNTGTQSIFHTAYGALRCSFVRLKLIGKDGITKYGMHLIGDAGGGTYENGVFSNYFENLFVFDDSVGVTIADNAAIYLVGDTTYGARANLNTFVRCHTGGWYNYYWIDNGHNNAFIDCKGNNSDGPQLITEGYHIRIRNMASTAVTVDNVFLCHSFDAAPDAVRIYLYNDSVAARTMFAHFYGLRSLNPTLAITAAAGAGAGVPSYTAFGNRGNIFSGTAPTTLGSVNRQFIAAQHDDAFAFYAASPELNSGQILLSGTAYAGSINAVSDAGGVSAVINDDSDAEFRIVKTSDGMTFTPLVTVDYNGDAAFTADVVVDEFLSLTDGGGKTISSGAITPTKGIHFLTSEGAPGTTTDDLTTIVGTGVPTNGVLILRPASGHTITVKNATGNIQCGSDRTLDSVYDRIVLQWGGTNWSMLSYADNE